MNTLRSHLLPAVALGTLLLVSPALALDNEAIPGTIVSAAEGQVVFIDAAGAQRILTLTSECSVLIDGRRAAIGDLRTGMAAMLVVNRNMQCMQILAASQIGRRNLW